MDNPVGEDPCTHVVAPNAPEPTRQCRTCKTHWPRTAVYFTRPRDPCRACESLRRNSSRAAAGGYAAPAYTAVEYFDRLLGQGPICAICQRDQEAYGTLMADHDHQTGALRGFLCRRCNKALGSVGDDPALLYGLASYLTAAVPQIVN